MKCRLQIRWLRMYQKGAKARGKQWALSDDEFYALVKERCHYCGALPRLTTIDMSGKGKYKYKAKVNGVDRKNNSVGYTSKNVLTCCSRCNKMKGTLTYKGFLNAAKAIYENQWVLISIVRALPVQRPSRPRRAR